MKLQDNFIIVILLPHCGLFQALVGNLGMLVCMKYSICKVGTISDIFLEVHPHKNVIQCLS